MSAQRLVVPIATVGAQAIAGELLGVRWFGLGVGVLSVIAAHKWHRAPRARAWVYCNRRWLTHLAVSIVVSLGLATAAAESHGSWETLWRAAVELGPERFASCLFLGAVCGVVARSAVKIAFLRAVLALNSVPILLLIAILTPSFLLVFKVAVGLERTALALGAASGVLIVSLRRETDARKEERKRLFAAVQSVVREQSLSATEADAFRFYATRKFGKLRRLLVRCRAQDVLSPFLALVSVALHRLRGNQAAAVANATAAIASMEREWPTLTTPGNMTGRRRTDSNAANTRRIYLHLQLSLILNLTEMDPNRNQCARTELRKLEYLANTCMCTRVIRALLAYEEAASSLPVMLTTEEPLDSILEALRANDEVLRRGQEPGDRGYLGRILQDWGPLNGVVMADIIGSAHLALGNVSIARTLLSQCVRQDPEYAPSYMHLGDCYLRILSVTRATHAAHLLDRATLCYWIARYLDKGAGSPKNRIRFALDRRMRVIDPDLRAG